MIAEEHWKKVGQRAHHGICTPLFALRTQNSSGIGEFLDLIPLIEWCKSVGFDCIQLLPLNETGDDPSPYNPLSSWKLDPIYLSMPQKLELENLPRHEIKKRKLEAMKDADLQQMCFSQMEKVLSFANEKGVFLIGDLPHFMSRDSIDVQENPHLFIKDFSAGSPPDPFNPQGQSWGFPLFNWQAMEKDNFAWWKKSMEIFSKLYHIYRIDHVLGFFRIWAIQSGKKAADGFYLPADGTLWEKRGRKFLEMLLETSTLLPIGEDLGPITPVVYKTIKDLGICGIKVMRWQGNLPLDQYEPFSMTTLSTPDMETTALWWQKYPEEAMALCAYKKWQYKSTLSQDRQIEILKDSHKTSSYFHINLLQEYLYPFSDLRWENPEKDRINVPGTLLPTNWNYRYRPTIEEIAAHQDLAKMIRQII